MNTKEAIKLLKKYIEHPWSIEVGGEDAEKFKLIVKLLQRGKKFKEIVQDFEDRYGRYTIYTGSGTDKNNSYLMGKIKQKYFPKA